MTDGYVLDSSVAIRWYAPQVGYEHAREVRRDLLNGSLRLEAPDICRWETTNVLRKLWLSKLLDAEKIVLDSATDLDGLGVTIHPFSGADLTHITQLALANSLALFDAAYVYLALTTGLPLLTADAHLVRGVGGLVSTELLRGVAGSGVAP